MQYIGKVDRLHHGHLPGQVDGVLGKPRIVF